MNLFTCRLYRLTLTHIAIPHLYAAFRNSAFYRTPLAPYVPDPQQHQQNCKAIEAIK